MIYQDINIALEVFCAFMCLILLVNLVIEKKKTASNQWFSCMLICNIVMIAGDWCDWFFNGKPGVIPYLAQLLVALIAYYAMSGLLLYCVFRWLLVNIQQKREVRRIWIWVAKLITGVQVLIAITMPIHKICYIDEQNRYVRGDNFLVAPVLPFVVYLIGMVLLIWHRKAFSKKEMFYLGLFTVIPLLAAISQIALAQYSTLNIAVSFGLLITFTFIQSQQDYHNEQKIKELALSEKTKIKDMQVFQENLSEQLIEVLCSTVEAKDRYTRGHSLRVAQYAREIMYRLGGTEKEQQEVYYIGILHDVGKIHIKDEIINKKGRLTEEEYEQIKIHTIAGYQILHGINVIPNLAIGARWHHERYDGTGYPNALEGENIPLVARIISVADAYDAMTSNRSYHKTMDQAHVRNEIKNGMGTQFDPKIAQIMLDMIDEDLQYEMRQVVSNKPITILVIDDDEFSHTLVQQALIEEPYELTSVYNGADAISYLQEDKYDLCLLDMEMAGINGFEVLMWIRKNLRKQNVIFLTGEKSIEMIKKAEEYGVRDYITKPINANMLTESIKSVLGW